MKVRGLNASHIRPNTSSTFWVTSISYHTYRYLSNLIIHNDIVNTRPLNLRHRRVHRLRPLRRTPRTPIPHNLLPLHPPRLPPIRSRNPLSALHRPHPLPSNRPPLRRRKRPPRHNPTPPPSPPTFLHKRSKRRRLHTFTLGSAKRTTRSRKRIVESGW